MLKLYTGAEPVSVPLETVLAAMAAIIRSGHDQEFTNLCRDKQAQVLVEGNVLNLVKTYLNARDIAFPDAIGKDCNS